jgi:hypothetical protein
MLILYPSAAIFAMPGITARPSRGFAARTNNFSPHLIWRLESTVCRLHDGFESAPWKAMRRATVDIVLDAVLRRETCGRV